MNQDDMLDDVGSQMIVSVESHDVLELTITKTNLDVFTELGKVCILKYLGLFELTHTCYFYTFIGVLKVQ